MELNHLSFEGPRVDDFATLIKLPSALRSLLEQLNGFIAFGGGLHVRGACLLPKWHSLSEAWAGEAALWRLYPNVLRDNDVPFGEDAVGDQFLLRDEKVIRLQAETGEIEPLNCDLLAFLEAAWNDPLGMLGLHPLIQFGRDGGRLQSGQLLSVYPPFCTREAALGVSFKAVETFDRRRFLADFAAQIAKQ